MKHTALLVLPPLLILGACTAIEPAAAPAPAVQSAPAAETEPVDTAIPYPTLDTESQINTLGLQVARLEKLVDLIIHGGYLGQQPTTVVDLTDDSPVVIREGVGDVKPFL